MHLHTWACPPLCSSDGMTPLLSLDCAGGEGGGGGEAGEAGEAGGEGWFGKHPEGDGECTRREEWNTFRLVILSPVNL